MIRIIDPCNSSIRVANAKSTTRFIRLITSRSMQQEVMKNEDLSHLGFQKNCVGSLSFTLTDSTFCFNPSIILAISP